MSDICSLLLLRKYAEYQQFPELFVASGSLAPQGNEGGDLAVLALQAFALGQMHQRDRAAALIEQVEAGQGALDTDGLCDLAACYITLQRLDEAEQLLRRILMLEPLHGLAYARLGYCKMLADNTGAAIEAYRRAVERLPERIGQRLVLAELYRKDEQFEALQTELDSTLDVLTAQQPTLPEAVYLRYRHQLIALQLELWIVSGQQERAEEWLNYRAADLDDDEIVHWVLHCSACLAGQDGHAEATELLREWLKTYPDNLPLLMQLAELAEMQGYFMQAYALLQRAIRKDEVNVGLRIKLAQLCLHYDASQAREQAEKAVELAQALEVPEVVDLTLQA